MIEIFIFQKLISFQIVDYEVLSNWSTRLYTYEVKNTQIISMREIAMYKTTAYNIQTIKWPHHLRSRLINHFLLLSTKLIRMYPATRLNLMVILHVDILQGERIMTVMKYKTGSTIAINNLGISRLSFLLHYLYSIHQHIECGMLAWITRSENMNTTWNSK